MKRRGQWWALGCWLCFPSVLAAQEPLRTDVGGGAVSPQPQEIPDTACGRGRRAAARGFRPAGTDTLRTDSLAVSPGAVALPPLRWDGTVAYFPYGGYGGWGVWGLHEGFNASLSMSISASFGRNRFPGVGFGTGVSAMYVRALTDRLVWAAGGFYDRMSWNMFNQHRMGFSLLAGYKLSGKVSLYAYGSKAFFPGGRAKSLPMPWLDDFSHRVGGMLHFKVSDAVSFSVSIEERGWAP